MIKPVKIGLTGGIGSGKSTIAKIFKSLGVPVFNSDLEAKNIINNDADTVELITNEFGDVYLNGVLDSKKMAAIVFNDDKALSRLNAIVHPRVKETFENWVSNNENEEVLIKEAAILFEIGAYKELDSTILVVAPEKLKLKRVVSRDKSTEEEVRKRMSNQLPDEDKIKLADFVIYNNEEKMLIPQVIKCLYDLKNRQ